MLSSTGCALRLSNRSFPHSAWTPFGSNPATLVASMDTQALWLTLRLALSTTVILLLIALPLVLPPTVLGFYLLVALGPLTAPGRLIIRLLGHPLAFSFAGLLVGSVLYSLPFAVQPLVAGFRVIDPALLEAAATLGASPLRAFRTITLPLAKPSL